MKKIWTLMLVIVIATMLSGCYWNEGVSTSEIAAQKVASEIKGCVGPGIYTSGDWWGELEQVSVGAVTFSVEDPEVLTSTNQAVGVKLTIQARRNSDCEALKNLLTNWPALKDDGNLITTISATAREGMKNGVREFSLEGLLNDRNGLAKSIKDQVQEDANKYGVTILNVTVENIAMSPEYTKLLNEKALVAASVEKAVKEQDLVKQTAANAILQAQQSAAVQVEQLKVEQAKTAVEVEIASREGKKIAEAQKVYSTNPQAYELKKYELLAQIFGNKSTVYFVPSGTDLTMFFNPSASAVPVQVK